MSDNTVLGRGKLYFERFQPNTDTPIGGERFLGNCPSFALSVETQELDHYKSTEGLRIKDQSVTLQIDMTGTITCDNVDKTNLALFFFGTSEVATQGALTGQTDTFTATPGAYYQLGRSTTNPAGLRQVTVNSVTIDPAGTPSTATVGDDYTVDAVLGRIQIVEGGAISEGDTIEVGYDVAAHSRNRIISGSNVVYGGMRFIAFNPVGENTDFFMPKVAVRPNGEFNLLGEDWQQFSFNLEVLRRGTDENIYADGRPFNVT